MLRDLWKFITNIGIHDRMTLFDERAIKLMNQISFIMVFWFSFVVLMGLFHFEVYGFAVSATSLILFGSVLIFNSYKNITFSKHYFVIFGLVMVTVVNIGFNSSNIPMVQFITTTLFPVLIFRNNKTVFAYLIINFLLFILVIYYHQNYEPFIVARHKDVALAPYFSVMIIMIVAFLIAFFFRNVGDDLERKIVRKNEYLNDLIEKMKTMQEQMINSEKMASLGQLTAGIAHEINNPINFVSSNINPLKTDLIELKELCKQYKDLHKAVDPATELRRISEYSDKIDPEFLYQEIETLIAGIEEGAGRTKQIVLGLRNFSRVDEDEFKEVDLHEGIESTLMLLKNKIKNRIEVTKDFGAIPKVECIPGKINQVFMNILNNAAEAIENKGQVWIKTSYLKNLRSVVISIRDDGPGMQESTRRRIFEPFYTTKDIGKGTGLGLSISYGIIEKHNGSIEVKSNPGQGAEFIITLPIVQTTKS
ncbi:MAG: HAMP domain-containing histidine kinase [Bacteroidales bacterium]|nr:HAMP domain-containing histidine kinase [Bacteroidales bacterium]